MFRDGSERRNAGPSCTPRIFLGVIASWLQQVGWGRFLDATQRRRLATK